MKGMKTMKQRSVLAAALLLALCGAGVCWADWAQAESPDFPLDTTVPEPRLVALGALGAVALAMRARRKALVCVVCGALLLAAGRGYAGRVVVTNVMAQQRPDEAVVDISYDLLNPSGGLHVVSAEVFTNSGYLFGCTNFSGAVGDGIATGLQKQVVWNAGADLPGVSGVQARVRVTALEKYLVIDIAAGPAATNYPYYFTDTVAVQSDEYKMTKIVLRAIPAGQFVMGSPPSELGRYPNEQQHMVTLTHPFYISVYEVTQAQYSNVMGSNSSHYQDGGHAPKRPMDGVSWNTARGGTWPGGIPDSASFVGRLRSKTGLRVDLPTEAQWEYACRAGTTKALNNDTDLDSVYQDTNMDMLGRYYHNGGSNAWSDAVNGAHTSVGSYVPNRWGLYDLHGNVGEWCLDWYGGYGGEAVNPVGPGSGTDRVVRGGSWFDNARLCRSAMRDFFQPGYGCDTCGFRVLAVAGD